ncbi:hypothetical protein EGI32_18920 [Ferruginibacter sp. HRS2-29]|nr:hypothetical protein [Ferruginibacter sp. HRS2-29]
MKKIILIVMIIAGAQAGFGQVNKNAPGSEGVPSCPPGFCAYWQYIFETFNFHRPRTDCKTGFGLCIKGRQESGCRPCASKTPVGTKIENGKATCIAEVKNGKLELRIPAGIKTSASLDASDMSDFTLDKGVLNGIVDGKFKTNREGTYPVKLIENEYVVLIDLE